LDDRRMMPAYRKEKYFEPSD